MPVHAHDGTERLEPKWMCQSLKEFVPAVMGWTIACVIMEPSEDMRLASQGGTRPPCRGRIAVPERLAIESQSPSLPEPYQADVPRSGSSVIVRNVMEYRGASTAGMLCSHVSREGPDIM
jgi:hypothetical protein